MVRVDSQVEFSIPVCEVSGPSRMMQLRCVVDDCGGGCRVFIDVGGLCLRPVLDTAFRGWLEDVWYELRDRSAIPFSVVLPAPVAAVAVRAPLKKKVRGRASGIEKGGVDHG